MATAFQPNLGTARAHGVPQTPIQGPDLSGAFNAVSRLFKNNAQVTQQQAEAREAETYADTLTGLLDLRNQSNRLSLAEQNLETTRQNLQEAGVLSDEESEAATSFQKQMERLKQMRSQGIGNELVYNTRVNTLLKNALSKAPSLAPEIDALARGELSDFSGAPQQTRDQIEFHNRMVEEFGVNYTTKDVNKIRDRDMMLADFDNRVKAGNITAGRLVRQSGEMYNLIASDVTQKWQTVYDNQGFLNTDQMEQYKQEMANVKTRAESFLDRQITSAEARKSDLFQPDTVEQIMDSINDEHEYLVSFVDQKDLGTRLKLHNEIVTRTIESQFPGLFNVAKTANGLAGIGGTNGLLAALDDENTQNMLAASGKTFINNLSFTREQLTAELYNLMMTGVTVQDPGMQQMMATVAGSTLTRQPMQQASTTMTNYIDQLTRDPAGDIVSDNIEGTLDTLLSMDARTKSNYIQELTQSDKNKLRIMTQDQLEKLSADFLEDIDQASIDYDMADQKFKVETRGDFANPRQRRSINARLNRKTRAINKLLRLTRDPDYSSFLIKPNEVISFVRQETAFVADEAREEPTLEQQGEQTRRGMRSR